MGWLGRLSPTLAFASHTHRSKIPFHVFGSHLLWISLTALGLRYISGALLLLGVSHHFVVLFSSRSPFFTLHVSFFTRDCWIVHRHSVAYGTMLIHTWYDGMHGIVQWVLGFMTDAWYGHCMALFLDTPLLFYRYIPLFVFLYLYLRCPYFGSCLAGGFYVRFGDFECVSILYF
jgi:hypothetical protein